MDNMILGESANPDSKNIIAKEEEYTKYINHHVDLVKKAYYDLFVHNLTLSIPDYDIEVLRETIRDIEPDIQTHDASKFSDEEFYGYRERFYPTEFEKEHIDSDPAYADMVYDKYQKAWQHHFMHNDHHCFYWKCENGQYSEDNEPRDMSLGAIIHMLCDWQSMSWISNGTTVDWWNNDAEKERNAMSLRTIEIVEEFLEALYKEK